MDPNQSNQNEPQSNHQSGADDPHATPASSSSELSYDDKQMAMFCHFLAFAGIIVPFGAIIGPLVLWLIKKDQSEFINYHGKEAINFSITMTIVVVVCAILIMAVVGILLLPLALMLWLVFIIVAGIKANEGEYYRYPFSLRLID